MNVESVNDGRPGAEQTETEGAEEKDIHRASANISNKYYFFKCLLSHMKDDFTESQQQSHRSQHHAAVYWRCMV